MQDRAACKVPAALPPPKAAASRHALFGTSRSKEAGGRDVAGSHVDRLFAGMHVPSAAESSGLCDLNHFVSAAAVSDAAGAAGTHGRPPKLQLVMRNMFIMVGSVASSATTCGCIATKHG